MAASSSTSTQFPVLSSEEGDTIARIDGGQRNKEIIYVDESGKYPIQDAGAITRAISDVFEGRRSSAANANNKLILYKFIKMGKAPSDEKLEEDYKKVIARLDTVRGKELHSVDGKIMPLPSFKKRDCIYVGGPSGSGKSVWVSNYCKQYVKLFPKTKIYLFSKVEDDPAFESLIKSGHMIKIPLTDALAITTDELAGSLTIFDDIDTMAEGAEKKGLMHLVDDILQTGRHKNIYIIRTTHILSNRTQTAIVLNESSQFVIFPRSGAKHQIEYMLSTHVGLDREQIKRIYALPSRWVVIHKNYPMCVVYESGVYLL
jgi:hypothetical protein